MLISKFQFPRLIKHSTIYAIGSISRQLVGFLMLPIYTRYLTPADYGVIGMLSFAIALMEPLFGARLSESLPKFYYEQKKIGNENAVVSTALFITGIVSAATALILILLRTPSSQLLFDTVDYGLAIGLFSTLILTQAIEYYALIYIRIQQQPMLFLKINLTKLAFQISLNIWLIVILKLEVMGMILSSIISSSLYALGSASYLLYKTGNQFDFQLAKRMLKFSWPLWLSGLASLYIFSSNRYFIRLFGSLEEVGLYELGVKFTMIIMLVWGPFFTYWETERFNYYERENSEKIFQNVFLFIVLILTIIGLGISIYAELVISIMAAPAFRTAAAVVPLLCLSELFICVSKFYNFSFLITENTIIITRINYIIIVFITILNITLIPLFGYIGAAIAMLLAMILQCYLSIYLSKRYYDMQLSISIFLKFVMIAIVGYFIAKTSSDLNTFWESILWQSVIYFLFFSFLISFLWRNPETREYITRYAYYRTQK